MEWLKFFAILTLCLLVGCGGEVKKSSEDKVPTQRKAVVSSALRSAGYDPNSKVLELEFTGGEVYQYANVPEETYKSLMSAPSKGKYFHAQIKGKYSYTKLPAQKP